MEYFGQAAQDAFVLYCTNFKRGGIFLEIGSNDPVQINNTWILESKYDWRGIMVEYETHWLDAYKEKRKHAFPIIEDATVIDWTAVFEARNLPKSIDYLQIDLEAENRSTLTTLENLDKQVMDSHTFAVVTFEHDSYRGDDHNTRVLSRAIFERRGYVRVFSDIKNCGNPYEDWYVHPSAVDMSRITPLITGESLEWQDALRRFNR